jgi:hypothetical protein
MGRFELSERCPNLGHIAPFPLLPFLKHALLGPRSALNNLFVLVDGLLGWFGMSGVSMPSGVAELIYAGNFSDGSGVVRRR